MNYEVKLRHLEISGKIKTHFLLMEKINDIINVSYQIAWII